MNNLDKANAVNTRKKKINLKEKKLVTEYVKNNFNKRQAALKVYNVNPNNASSLGKQVLDRPHVQEYLAEQLDKAGLSLDDLNGYLTTSVKKNMDGKPSQAVAADLIKFGYRLHNALPASKSVKATLDLTPKLETDNTSVMIDMMKQQMELNTALLKELQK